MAPWRSGDAADCKSVYPSSILGGASNNPIKILFLLIFLKIKKLFLLLFLLSKP